MEAATARTAPAVRPAPRRKPRRRTTQAKRKPRAASANATRANGRRAPAGRLMPHKTGRASASLAARPRIMAGAALFPQAAMRSAGAVSDISESRLIVRLTRGRSWIAVLSVLLGGIVALNVLSLSLTAGSGQQSLEIDELQTDISSLHAQIDEKLAAGKVEAEAASLGLANPDPKQITFLTVKGANAQRVAHLLATDGFLLAPSQPSSYPAPGTAYAPVPTSTATTPTTTTAPTATAAPAETAPTQSAPPSTATAPSGEGDGTTGSGTSSGSSSTPTSTGGVGL
jgi:hypothetical protein